MILTTLSANPAITCAGKVRDIITNRIIDMDDTRKGSNVIDDYEKRFPNESVFVFEMRNLLCDRTFEVYANKHKN
jgi:hypothetical protein